MTTFQEHVYRYVVSALAVETEAIDECALRAVVLQDGDRVDRLRVVRYGRFGARWGIASMLTET